MLVCGLAKRFWVCYTVLDTSSGVLQHRAPRYAYHTRPVKYFFFEVFEVRRGDYGLGTPQKILRQVPPASLVELTHHVVKEEYGVLSGLGAQVLPGRELQGKCSEPLLTLRPLGRHAHPPEEHREVVPVRSDRGGATLYIGPTRFSECLRVLFQWCAVRIAQGGLLGAV